MAISIFRFSSQLGEYISLTAYYGELSVRVIGNFVARINSSVRLLRRENVPRLEIEAHSGAKL